MSSFEKVVKLACKPKAAPPKAKYLDTILAATWSDDGAVHDVCKALSPRFREPNAIVVFKALIVLHTMMRNGSTDNVLSYLSSSPDILRLRNVSNGSWEGYTPPQNLQNYAVYLESRIRAYHHLKHDAIQVQSESNRDMRNNTAIEQDRATRGSSSGSKGSSANLSRSKTMMGRKLRVMTVEKGLLRETKAVHRMIDTLVECRFYLDDLEDDLTVTSLRMLVKDLLILFQAGNEGVINLLEHYFEMSLVDAKEALSIYRNFCKQTEAVVEYLGVAKKLQNLLNVPIPSLKHAPVSLAGALQEYLDDPNFEQNRLEYRANKSGDRVPAAKPTDSIPPVPAIPSAPSAPSTSTQVLTAVPRKEAVDFFAGIEEEQSPMFSSNTNSPSQAYFQQQAATNPFAQRQMATGTGQHSLPQQMPPSIISSQPTGFSGPSNPFGLHPIQAQPTGHRPFSSYLQPQATGFMQHPQQPAFLPQSGGFPQQQVPMQTGFLQAQPTGNPFRQSMLVPQTTGMALFSGMNNSAQSTLSTSSSVQPSNFGAPLAAQSSAGPPSGSSIFNGQTSTFSLQQSPNSAPPFLIAQTQPSLPLTSSSVTAGSSIARPASTPLAGFGQKSPPSIVQPIKTHQTGTNNPFGRVVTPPPAVPRHPTLFELQFGGSGNFQPQQSSASSSQPIGVTGMQSTLSSPPTLPTQWNVAPGSAALGFNSGALSAGETDMGSVASTFSLRKQGDSSDGSSGGPDLSPGVNGQSSQQPSLGQNAFSMNSLSSSLGTPSMSSAAPIQPQKTGLAGIKEFKPSSSFGASLLESLPPIPGTSNQTGSNSSPLAASGGGQSVLTGPLATQATGMFNSFGMMGGKSSVGQGLRPQMTGGGAANPFRASYAVGGTAGNPSGGMGAAGLSTNPLGAGLDGFRSGSLATRQANESLI